MPVVLSAPLIIIIIIIPLTQMFKHTAASSCSCGSYHAEKPSVTVQKRLSPARAEIYLLRRSE